jgi:hypothetical protein
MVYLLSGEITANTIHRVMPGALFRVVTFPSYGDGVKRTLVYVTCTFRKPDAPEADPALEEWERELLRNENEPQFIEFISLALDEYGETTPQFQIKQSTDSFWANMQHVDDPGEALAQFVQNEDNIVQAIARTESELTRLKASRRAFDMARTAIIG